MSANPIHECDGLWYFWDETETEELGPWECEVDAEIALSIYCQKLNGNIQRRNSMKEDYIIPGMPSEVARIHQIWEHKGKTSVFEARLIFETETDNLAIRENDARRYKLIGAAPDLLAALERAVKYIPHRNANALAQAKNAISKAYNG